MPEVRLDAADAAELAEMLRVLTGWLARDPPAWPLPWKSSLATPPMTSASCARTWSGLSFCSAAATASRSSAHDQGLPGPGRGALLNDRLAVVPSMC
jgi:hypothetical protein